MTFYNKFTILSTEEASSLYSFIKDTDGDILELGRFYGGSTKVILEAIKETDRVLVSVDRVARPLLAFTIEDKYLCNNLIAITADSTKVKYDKLFKTVFIDTNHSVDAVISDIKNCWNNVDKYFIFHDYITSTSTLDGVKIVVDKLISSKILNKVKVVNTLCITEKNDSDYVF